MENSILKLQELCAKNLRDEKKPGICSVCSSHLGVIDASLKQSLEDGSPLLIESTSNQVDQYGGYTGMKPADFLQLISREAKKTGYDPKKIIFGGDHLGPNRWQNEAAEVAMEKAKALVASYVQAGYRKIHLDASMSLGGDGKRVSEEVVAERTAILCEVAEKSFQKLDNQDCKPLYVIGTEVPIPGGVTSEDGSILPTPSKDAIATRETTKVAFARHGLSDAWSRVIGMVVQPGVEYGNNWVSQLETSNLIELASTAEKYNDMVYEAHSTDYQPESSLKALVENHFAILKVGPWVSFAYREGLYALERIEKEAFKNKSTRSDLQDRLEKAMLQDDSKWVKYCHGDPMQQYLERHYGLSDRIRYYWNDSNLEEGQQILFRQFEGYSRGADLGLASQFMPTMLERIAQNNLSLSRPRQIVEEYVRDVLRIYHRACGFPC